MLKGFGNVSLTHHRLKSGRAVFAGGYQVVIFHEGGLQTYGLERDWPQPRKGKKRSLREQNWTSHAV